ncbi:MAG: hypothetical protein GY730_10020 [bacterium]|nr:hypothetical protein [bacterium]
MKAKIRDTKPVVLISVEMLPCRHVYLNKGCQLIPAGLISGSTRTGILKKLFKRYNYLFKEHWHEQKKHTNNNIPC